MTKIAWIEDDHDEISSLVGLLELDGYVIPRYRTRQDVENSIDEIIACDGIILDIILPPIKEDDPHQGISILKILREKYNYKKPVIVCTVVRAPIVMDRLHKLGVPNGDILHIPVRPSVLASAVKNALERQ